MPLITYPNVKVLLLMSTICRSSQDLKFHCSVINANLKYRWSASPCAEHHYFVCQHRMPYVSDKNRYKVYSKWNESYPNEMANEMEVVLEELPRGRRRLSPKQVAESNNQIDLTVSAKPRTATRRPQNNNSQAPQRRRKTHIFDKEMSNGRFTNDPTRNVDFGAPKRNGLRRRRKHRTSTTSTTTTTTTTTTPPTPTQPPHIYDNTLDANAEQQRQIEQENRRRAQDAEWRAKHRQRQEEHRRKYLERKRKEEEQRLQRQPTQEPETTTTYYRDYITAAPQLTEDEILEQKRLAETRRLLGIEKSPGYKFFPNVTTPAENPRRVTVPHTTLPPVTIDPEESKVLAEERRIRAEEERQRIEYEKQQLADQQAQEEARRQEIEANDRRHKEEQQKRDYQERKRLIEERRAQEEEIERQRQEHEQEEERHRLEEEKRVKEAHRLQQKQIAQMERKAKMDELKRLKEKSKAPMYDNETGTGDETIETERVRLDAEAEEARQLAAIKKEKRDKLKAKLQSMSPEMREEFFRQRNERNRKREAQEIPAQ